MKSKQNFRMLVLLALLLCGWAGGSVDRAECAPAPVEAWVQRFSCPGDSIDQAVKVVVDSGGNVIVAGNTDQGINGNDWLIIKYSGAGLPLWTNFYNGPANGDDSVSGLAVDKGDNVLVTGTSAGLGGGFDYVTIKFAGAGAALWTNRFDGPAGQDDQSSALGVDDSGSVYVTGSAMVVELLPGEAIFHPVCATLKYSSAGLPLWTNLYSGPGDVYAQVTALAVDGNANVYVAGWSEGYTGSDYMTLAYSSAGAPLWTNRFNQTGTNYGRANAVAVAAGGKVFVTGYDNLSPYLTLAFSSTGTALWTNRYGGPENGYGPANTLAVDTSGNVVVTGTIYSSNSSDYVTIAYSGLGLPLWTNHFDGPVGGYHSANGLAVDRDGNVLVTGGSFGTNSYGQYATVKYTGDGTVLWTNFYPGTADSNVVAYALAVDDAGNVFVTGSAAPGRRSRGGGGSHGNARADFATIAYSGAGVAVWTNLYNGPGGGGALATAVVVDGVGNVFVAGVAGTSTPDYVTIAYSDTGTPRWTNSYNGPGNGPDIINAMALDNQGNVFVTGSSIGSGGFPEFATIGYSNTGTPLWTNRYSGPGESFGIGSDSANAIGVDGAGNVYVTGGAARSEGYNSEYVTIKYSGAGAPLWTNRYVGPENISGEATALAVGGNGNITVTGASSGVGGSDYATIAYSGAGVGLWTNRYNGAGNGYDRPNAVAVDGGGNSFVTGYSYGTDGWQHFATIGYSSTGAGLWTNRYAGPGGLQDQANAVAVDQDGSVFVAGSSSRADFSFDYDCLTIKYSGAGVPLWTNRYGPSLSSYGSALAVDGSGNVIVTGSAFYEEQPILGVPSSGAGNSWNYLTIAYSSAGAGLWTNSYDGPAHGEDNLSSRQSLALGPDGSVYVCGSSDGDNGAGYVPDLVTVKYAVAPPLRINTSDGRFGFTNGVFGFTYSGAGGQSVVVEGSSNLANWNPLATNSAGSNPVYFSDPQSGGQPARFYRVRQQ